MFYKLIKLNVLLSILVFSNIFSQEKSLHIKNDSIKILSLDDCIQIALDNNHKLKASKENIKIAEAQKKQAESGYWPQLSLNAAYTLMDQDPNFVFPSFNMSIPVTLPGINFNLDNITVPGQSIKLMDKQNVHGGLTLTYPIYSGGKVQSINEQAGYNFEIAKQESRKTDLQIIFDVKRYYYAVVLTNILYKIGKEALERLEATLSLTESLYKNGSGKVTKIDYLRNKIFVDQVSTLISEIEGKQKISKEALLFTLGAGQSFLFDVSAEAIPNAVYNFNADSIAADAFNYNPDWSKINSAIGIFKSKIDEAKSGFLPNLALFGKLDQNFNSYEYGIVNRNNKTIWTVGLGIEMPVFSGFKTSGEVDEAEAKLNKTISEKNLLQSAIILQIRNACYEIAAMQDKLEKTIEAINTAEENRSLNERAFQADMVEADELIEAQILESFVQAQYQKALYDHLIASAKLELILGKDIN